MNIEELVVGARAYNVLKDAGIDTVEDLCLFTGEQLMRFGKFGRKSLDDVQSALSEHSLSPYRTSRSPADRFVSRRRQEVQSGIICGQSLSRELGGVHRARARPSSGVPSLVGDACNWANSNAAVDDQRTRWDAALRSPNGSRQERRAIRNRGIAF